MKEIPAFAGMTFNFEVTLYLALRFTWSDVLFEFTSCWVDA